MFAGQQQRQLGRTQLFAHKAAYKICDEWGRGGDGSDRMTIRKKASDTAVFQDLDPDLKGRVLAAAKNSANGKTTPEDEVLESEIESMLESGELTPQVGAALLRLIHTAPEPETGFQVLSPSLSDRTDGESDAPTRYYDPTGPAGGGYKGAGDRRFMNLLKGYMDSHRIGWIPKSLTSPARAGARFGR